MRDVGNYFAGFAARIAGQSKLDFLTTAGAFNLHSNDKLDLVFNLSTYKAEARNIPFTFGEDERSNYFQRLGYEAMLYMLTAVFEATGSNDLTDILSGGEYWPVPNRPADSVFWEYWLEAIEKVKKEGSPPIKELQ